MARPEDLPPELRLLVEAWPHLPDAVRTGILAMVESCMGQQKRPPPFDPLHHHMPEVQPMNRSQHNGEE